MAARAGGVDLFAPWSAAGAALTPAADLKGGSINELRSNYTRRPRTK